MIPSWYQLTENDRAVFHAAVSFLSERLAERDSIDWALRLKPNQKAERVAVEFLLNDREESPGEPWATCWRLIEESWSRPPVDEHPSLETHRIARRLGTGERSGAIIAAISNLVAPRLELTPIDEWHWRYFKKPRHPNTVSDLLSINLTSGQLIDLRVLQLSKIDEIPFLRELANTLDAAVKYGLDASRRIGWNGKRPTIPGFLNHVYYTQQSRRDADEEEPDAHHRGIAPSVKFLHAVVSRMAALDVKAALPFVRAWRTSESPISLRLWASMARDPKLVSGAEVGEFIVSLDDRQFWDLHIFPEVAELRASRFAEFMPTVQKAIISRLRKGPPRSHWPRKAEADRVKGARHYWAFAADSALRMIRDTLIGASGRSGLIVRHRLIEFLPYFLRADAAWAQTHLTTPLLADNNDSLALWRALARRTHRKDVLEIIGDAMVERAIDRRLGRETRGRLVFSLIVETLNALMEHREPAVSNSKILQMLRSLDDEVRARAADTLVQFVREVSAAKDRPSAAEVFRSAAVPFLRDIWPQERSLATPGVSSALSDLPAASGEAFAEAVVAIERFLVPFSCWSLVDYGLYGDSHDPDGTPKLSIVDDEAKAKALLRLLDLTVGTSEGAVIPMDFNQSA